MAMVSERIFGKTCAPAREITDITKARPGDIVVEMNSAGNTPAHVAIFLGYKPVRILHYGEYTINERPAILTCYPD